MTGFRHPLPFGANLLSPDRTRFRLWAPGAAEVGVEINGAPAQPMRPTHSGWHELDVACGAGTAYRYRVSPDLAVPDPASRAQSGDVHDPSIVVDPLSYDWKYPDWSGHPWNEAVIYELHVGLLGGFDGVTTHLAQLAKLGVTIIELMPVADFLGPRNWGYDGVLPFAPDAAYGSPDALKRLVDTAHGLGLMVMLDVVYNHFGPEGNYIGAYAPELYRHDRSTPWGDAIDFRRAEVRNYFIENALYWLNEFRFDGLRFDAVHAIGQPDFLREMEAVIRGGVASDRHVHLVLENEKNEGALLRSAAGARGFDAQWADDFHHCVHVLLTGEEEAYYEDFAAEPARLLARCLAEGFAYQGEPSKHLDNAPRGQPSAHLPPNDFVFCLQNHDQIGNRAFGERLTALAHPDALRAATVLLLLAPQIPLLFMGQEYGAQKPFLFFTGFTGDLADAVREGRRKEFARFAAFADQGGRARIPDPNHPATFEASLPEFVAGEPDPDQAAWWEFHQQLLALRARFISPHIADATSLGAQNLGAGGVQASWRLDDGTYLTLAANLKAESCFCPRLSGRLLFETRPGLIIDARAGMLPGRSALATLQDAPI